jgi:hypothetical protein
MMRHDDWEQAGREAGPMLDGLHAVAVLGDDPEATALIALGMARSQARRRRVAIADLFGELAVFERLLTEPAEHGIVDSFAYGVSLTKIARPIDAAQNLFLLPSGAAPIDHATILGSDRWHRLASGFREVDALLIAVVPADAPSLPLLLEHFDGQLLAVDAEARKGHPTIGRVGPASEQEVTPRGARPDDAITTASPAVAKGTAGPHSARRTRRPVAQLAAAAAAILVIAAITAVLITPMRSSEPGQLPNPSAGNGGDVSAEHAGVAEPPDTLPLVIVANPGDSATAAAYSVQLASHTGMASALHHVVSAGDRAVPAVTFSPVITGPSNARWYRVLAGAFHDTAQADSLLVQLRRRGSLEAEQGEVRYAPFSLLVERGVGREQASIYIRDYRDRSVPAYALLQPDGTANIYTGAFETPEQASLLLALLRERGEQPQVVYRIGRAF